MVSLQSSTHAYTNPIIQYPAYDSPIVLGCRACTGVGVELCALLASDPPDPPAPVPPPVPDEGVAPAVDDVDDVPGPTCWPVPPVEAAEVPCLLSSSFLDPFETVPPTAPPTTAPTITIARTASAIIPPRVRQKGTLPLGCIGESPELNAL